MIFMLWWKKDAENINRQDVIHFYSNSSKHAGKTKILTENCSECDFYNFDKDNEHICHWGIAWKRMTPKEKGNKQCEYFGKPSPREDEINRLLENKTYLKSNYKYFLKPNLEIITKRKINRKKTYVPFTPTRLDDFGFIFSYNADVLQN
jgi:hypothetical protein